MPIQQVESASIERTDFTGTLSLGGLDGLFGPKEQADDLSRRLFAHVCRAEGLRGRALAGVSLGILVLFLPMSFIFETRFQSLLGADVPRVGITQILLSTSLYGLLSAWLFRSRESYASRSFQILRYINATIEALMPSILLYSVLQFVQSPMGLVSPPLLFYFIFIGLSALRFDFTLAAYTGFIAALGYLGVARFALPDLWVPGSGSVLTEPLSHLERAAIVFTCGIIAGAVSTQSRRLLRKIRNAQRDRDKVRAIFGRHVSDVVANKLLSSEAGIEAEREVVVLFLDIRDFTKFSETRKPKEVVDYLNTLFKEFVDVIESHQGVVNKFLGDGIMAVFGAPEDDSDAAEHSCMAGIEIINRVKVLVASGQIPHTQLSVGLHRGRALTGTVGTETRQEYTVIGDTVNTAARIESLNRQFETTLLVSESVKLAAPQSCDLARPLGPVSVKGRDESVLIYSLDQACA